MEVVQPSVLSLGLPDEQVSVLTGTLDEGSLSTQQQLADDQIETVDDLLLKRIRDYPDSAFISYPASPRGKSDYVDYTASQVDQFADEAARRYAASGVLPDVSTLLGTSE